MRGGSWGRSGGGRGGVGGSRFGSWFWCSLVGDGDGDGGWDLCGWVVRVRGSLFGVLIRLGDGGAGVTGGSVGLFSFLHIHVRVGFIWSVFMKLLVSDMENKLSYPSCVPSSPRTPKFVIGAVIP